MVDREIKVVFAVPSFQPGFHTAMSEQFKKFFKPEEIILRTLTDDSSKWKEGLQKILEQVHPTALVAMDIRPDADTIAAYTNAHTPIIVIDEEAAGASTIAVDNFMGGRIAAEYLVKKGRKKIAIVSGRTQVKGGYNAAQRLKGFQQALNAGKLSLSPKCMVEVIQYSREDGLRVMPELLDAGVDAVFSAAGDKCALGLATVMKDRGIKIPEDVALVGFDDLLIAQISNPALTTIRQPLKEMAEAAYKMAVIERDKILLKPQKIMFKPELVIRQSA